MDKIKAPAGGNHRAARDGRLVLVGPMPPPVHGASLVMSRMVSDVGGLFARMVVFDTSGDTKHGPLFQQLAKLWNSLCPIWAIRNSDTVYISVKSGIGMWLNAAVAARARMTGARVFLHHHSYRYVNERKLRMVALTRGAGPNAYHIVLSSPMQRGLSAIMPEIRKISVVGNAGWIDQTLADLPLKKDGDCLVLGHLSNLSYDKGIAEVVDLAVALKQRGATVRLLIGGPAQDSEARLQISRARTELDGSFEYRGALTGESKKEFYREVSHFVFPSRNEALPLVLYEALAAGVVCVATRVGSVPAQLAGSPSVTAGDADSFVEEVLPKLAEMPVSANASRLARDTFLKSLAESERQFADFVCLLSGECQ